MSEQKPTPETREWYISGTQFTGTGNCRPERPEISRHKEATWSLIARTPEIAAAVLLTLNASSRSDAPLVPQEGALEQKTTLQWLDDKMMGVRFHEFRLTRDRLIEWLDARVSEVTSTTHESLKAAGYGSGSVKSVIENLVALAAAAKERADKLSESLKRAEEKYELSLDIITGLQEKLDKSEERAEKSVAQLADAKKDAESWKSHWKMYRDAWVRELGGWVVPKRHEIDSLVLTTRERCVNPLRGNCSTAHWLGRPTEDKKALQQTAHPKENSCRDWTYDDTEVNLRAKVAELESALTTLRTEAGETKESAERIPGPQVLKGSIGRQQG